MKRLAPLLVLGAILVVVAWSSAYVVQEVDQVILTQFGKPIGKPVVDAGLHWKIPFIQKVNRFEKRWLDWDGDAGEMPTREKNPIWVDTFARWRIADPLKFFTATKGDERIAQSRLDGIIDSETRNVVAAHDLIEVVRSTNREFELAAEAAQFEVEMTAQEQPEIAAGRDELRQAILDNAAEKATQTLGIELVDIQFQRVNYTDSVQKKVFDRMISERNRIAEGYRSEGEGKRAEILGKKELDLKGIESEAYREVQQIKGKADANATSIYAAAYNLEPSLFRLLKSLESYQETVDDDSWVILSTDNDYLVPLVSMPAR